MRRTCTWIGAFLLVVVLSGWSFAEEPKQEPKEEPKQELMVTSLHQKIDYLRRIFVYEGEVRLDWTDMLAEADVVSIYLTEENRLIKMVASGKVTITDKEQQTKVSCELATYTAEDDKIIFEGGTEYRDEFGNIILADQLIFWRTEEKMEATGSPVKATYFLEGVGIDSQSGESD